MATKKAAAKTKRDDLGFFGGRVEIISTSPIYSCDISSAYPQPKTLH